jgi:hypothetical protein
MKRFNLQETREFKMKKVPVINFNGKVLSPEIKTFIESLGLKAIQRESLFRDPHESRFKGILEGTDKGISVTRYTGTRVIEIDYIYSVKSDKPGFDYSPLEGSRVNLRSSMDALRFSTRFSAYMKAHTSTWEKMVTDLHDVIADLVLKVITEKSMVSPDTTFPLGISINHKPIIVFDGETSTVDDVITKTRNHTSAAINEFDLDNYIYSGIVGVPENKQCFQLNLDINPNLSFSVQLLNLGPKHKGSRFSTKSEMYTITRSFNRGKLSNYKLSKDSSFSNPRYFKTQQELIKSIFNGIKDDNNYVMYPSDNKRRFLARGQEN